MYESNVFRLSLRRVNILTTWKSPSEVDMKNIFSHQLKKIPTYLKPPKTPFMVMVGVFVHKKFLDRFGRSLKSRRDL